MENAPIPYGKKGNMEPLNKIHWEALTSSTHSVLHLLGSLKWINRYYLAGGTGLALHLGHRYSVDLDFFSDEEDAVNFTERADLRNLLRDPPPEIIYDMDTSFVATWQEVGISFFRLNQYPLILPTIPINHIKLASLPEIGAMKLAAIIGRGTRKDYIDLYFILQNVALDLLFQIAAKKYADIRSFPVSALRALSYFADAESTPMPLMIDKTPWNKMKKFLESTALQAARMELEDLWG